MRIITATLLLSVAVATLAHAEEKRDADAHEHGHGALNIAVSGNTVSIELEVPADDIVGFENEAKSQVEKDAVAAATKLLSDPLAMFTVASAAGCVTKAAKVEVKAEEHEEAAKKEEAKGGDEKAEAGHSEFHANYTVECASPANLTAMNFPYFKAFEKAQSLVVTIVTDKGQSKFDVTRDKPDLDMGGLM